MIQNNDSGLIVIAHYGLEQDLRLRNNAQTKFMFNIHETM